LVGLSSYPTVKKQRFKDRNDLSWSFMGTWATFNRISDSNISNISSKI